jgi:hypothetical protein
MTTFSSRVLLSFFFSFRNFVGVRCFSFISYWPQTPEQLVDQTLAWEKVNFANIDLRCMVRPVFSVLRSLKLHWCRIGEISGFPQLGKPNYCTTIDFEFNRLCASSLFSITLSFLPSVDLNLVTHLPLLKDIKIQSCLNVMNIHALREIDTIELSSCDNINSLAGLVRSNKIIVADMKNVRDFTPLKNIKKVQIHLCPKFSGGSHLRNVQFLTVQQSSTKDLGKIQSLKALKIIESKTQNLSRFGKVPSLTLTWCHRLSNLDGLKTNR